MNTRVHRQAQNQRTFRAANERMEQTIEGQVPAGAIIPFLCECADDRCRGRVDMNAFDYAGIHIDRELYIIVRGHPTLAGEEVVERNDGYDVVRKTAG